MPVLFGTAFEAAKMGCHGVYVLYMATRKPKIRPHPTSKSEYFKMLDNF